MLRRGAVLQQRYRIEKLLAHGGTADVYAVWHLALERRLALKQLRIASIPPLELSSSQRAMETEARLLADLQHAHLVRVWDCFREDDAVCLVLDFVDGHALDRLAADNPQPEAAVLSWTAQVLDCLGYLHGRYPPVIVRDLSPGNLMVTKTGALFVLDFGLAQGASDGSRTRPLRGTMGTPGFAPVEQYRAGLLDQRADFYSLGATMYFLLTGQVPPEATARVTGATLPDPRRVNASCSMRTLQTMSRLLEIKPDRRPASVAEIREMLELTAQCVPPILPAASGKAVSTRQLAASRSATRRIG